MNLRYLPDQPSAAMPEAITAWIVDRAVKLADDLEVALAEAVTLQDYGMLERLVVIDQPGHPATVGSLLFDPGRPR